MSSIPYGSHACLFHEGGPEDRIPGLQPFIEQGLRGGELCVVVIDGPSAEEQRGRWEESEWNLDSKPDETQLRLLTLRDWQREAPSPIHQWVDEARTTGLNGLRIAFEISSDSGSKLYHETLEHWGSELATGMDPEFPRRILCLYDRTRLSPEILLKALYAHPDVILDGVLRCNPFYQAPLWMKDGETSSSERLDWMLNRIRAIHIVGGENQKAEKQIQDVLNSISDGFFSVDDQWRFLFVNASAERLMGMPARELKGRNLWEVFPNAVGSIADREYRRALEQRTRVEFEYFQQRYHRWLQVKAAPMPAGGLSVFFQDITERKHSVAVEHELRLKAEHESAGRLRAEQGSRHLAAIVESSQDAIISKDLNGIVLSWNQGAEMIFGYTAEEAIGRPITFLIPEDRQAEEKVILQRIRNGERLNRYETVRRHKSGRLLDISLTISPIKDSRGTIVGASKIAQDLTRAKQKERQQSAVFELTAAVNRAEAMPEIYEAVLNAVCRCYEVPRAAILVRDDDGVMRFKAWRGLSAAYRAAVEGHSPWLPEHSDPQPVWVDDTREGEMDPELRSVLEAEDIRSLAFVPITYEKQLLGKLMLYFAGARGIGMEELRPLQAMASQVGFALQRQRAGRALEQLVEERTASLREAVAQMEEFSYSVSHDLRAPVRAMQGYARAVLEDYGNLLDSQGCHYLERIVRGAARMDRLIQDILSYSGLSRREVRLQPVAIGRLVREIMSQYPEMQSPRAEITLIEPLHDVIGHEPSLSQALSNLLSNAVKFVRRGEVPRVSVGTELRGAHVRLWVEDEGIGIRPEQQHRLFGLFERIHPEHEYEGTGIGLAIVRKAVERMGGTTGVKSDGARGSCFWIELPAARDAAR